MKTALEKIKSAEDPARIAAEAKARDTKNQPPPSRLFSRSMLIPELLVTDFDSVDSTQLVGHLTWNKKFRLCTVEELERIQRVKEKRAAGAKVGLRLKVPRAGKEYDIRRFLRDF